MKKTILLGLLLLNSASAFAEGHKCKFNVWFIRSGKADAEQTTGTFYQISKEQCLQEARQPVGSEHVTRMTVPGALIVKTKFVFVDQDGEKEKGVFFHSFWK